MSTFKIKRGTKAEIASYGLKDGQLLYEIDQGNLNKIYADIKNADGTLSRIPVGGNSFSQTTDVETGTKEGLWGCWDRLADLIDDGSAFTINYAKIGNLVCIDMINYAYYPQTEGAIYNEMYLMESDLPFTPYKYTSGSTEKTISNIEFTVSSGRISPLTTTGETMYTFQGNFQGKMNFTTNTDSTMTRNVLSPDVRVNQTVSATYNNTEYSVDSRIAEDNVHPYSTTNPTIYHIYGWYICTES